MAALTDAALAYIRSEVGGDVPEDDIAERFERLGNPRDVAMELVRTRLATVMSGPGAYNVTGVYSEENTSLIRGLQAQLTRLAEARIDVADGSAEIGMPEIHRARLLRRRRR